jgi:hypothetical protein
MDPAPLGPDRTLRVAADGTVALDFPLPRFGVSLLTLVPAPAPPDPPAGDGGCGCRAAGRDATPAPLALGGIAVLALILRTGTPKTRSRRNR